jgi:hypothetical protein
MYNFPPNHAFVLVLIRQDLIQYQARSEVCTLYLPFHLEVSVILVGDIRNYVFSGEARSPEKYPTIIKNLRTLAKNKRITYRILLPIMGKRGGF